MKAAELFAALGLRLDEKSWAAAETAAVARAQMIQDRISASAEHFSSVVLDTSRAARTGADDAVVSWDGWNAQAKKGTTLAEQFGKGLKIAFGVAAAIFVGSRVFSAVHGVVQDVADLGDKLDEMAQKTGVSVESLQEMSYAAGFSGLSLDDMAGNLGKLAKNMDGAAQGGKSQRKLFDQVGVSVKNADGSLRSVDAVFGDVAERFKSMPDGAAKTAMAMKLFGRGGASLIPTLNEGREGLAKLKQEFIDSGAEISGDSAAAFAKFNDGQDRLKKTMFGLKVQLVQALLPALQSIVTGLSGWIKANRKVLASGMRTALKALIAVFKTLASVIGTVVEVLGFLADHWKVVAIAMSAMLLTKIIPALALLKWEMIKTAVASAIAWAAPVLEFLLIAAVITALILVLEDLYRAFTGGDSYLKELYDSAVKWLTWDRIFQGLQDGFKKVLDKLRQVGATIADELGLPTDFLTHKANQAPEDGAAMQAIRTGNQAIAARRRRDAGTAIAQGGGAAPFLSAAFGLAGGPAAAVPAIADTWTAQASQLPDATAPAAGPQFHTTVQVTAAKGMSETELADAIDKKIRESNEEQAAQLDAAAGVGQERGWTGRNQ